MSTAARQVQLGRQPSGHIRADDFHVVEVPLPAMQPGQVRIRNEWMSVDPYMRLVLSGQEGFLDPMQPGDVLNGAAIGVVAESSDPQLAAGTRVMSLMGWRSDFVATPAELTPITDDAPPQWHLGFLGLTGITAHVGIEKVLQPKTGETIFISGASGAVGSIACQLAKLRGARVLGSAGTAEKSGWLLDEVGIDAVVAYKSESLEAFLEEQAPDGLDCYFDNVGGAMLEKTLPKMKPYGRVGLCGAMSQYETSDYRHGPKNFFSIIEKSLSLKGFNAFLLQPQESAEIVQWLSAQAQAGRIKPFETIVDGLEHAAEAFANLFENGYLGKLIVKI